MKRRFCIACLTVAVVLGASPSLAHSGKQSTVPPDGAVLGAAPDTIAMTFDTPMRLTMFRLTNGAGAEVDVQRSDGMSPVTLFEATPAMLTPGTYTVQWRGLADDGHAMQGRFSFEIAD